MFANLFCSECIRYMPPAEFAVWLAVGLGVTGFSLLGAYRNFKRSRLVADMPTSLIRSASQGYSELVGVAQVREAPILAPLTARPCLWWYYQIERYQSSGKSSHWVTLEKKSSDAPFLLKDSTGICVIEPDGAEISSLHKKVWYGSCRRPAGALPGADNEGFFSLTFSGIGLGRRYRYTERLIKEGDPLYALGFFSSDASGQRTASLKKLSGEILKHWKQDFQALLEKYDTDGSGELDLKEWQVVRDAAEKAASKQLLTTSGKPTEHSLSKPGDGLPFIIGSEAQEVLVKKFRNKAFGLSLGFLAAGAVCTWLLNARWFY